MLLSRLHTRSNTIFCFVFDVLMSDVDVLMPDVDALMPDVRQCVPLTYECIME